IGKTRLLHEVESRAVAWRVLKAGTDPYESATPYRTIKAVMRQVLGVSGDAPTADVAARLRARVQTITPHLMPWLPLLADPLDVIVHPTPEVHQLSEQFRKERREHVLDEFLGAELTTPTLFS